MHFKTLLAVALDCVIMSPSMILTANNNAPTMNVYLLYEHWAVDCESGNSLSIYSDLYEAKANLEKSLTAEIESGCISDWLNDDNYITETTDLSYEGWIDGRYCENHYSISIEKLILKM